MQADCPQHKDIVIAADSDFNCTLDVLLAFYVGKVVLDGIEHTEDCVWVDRKGPDRQEFIALARPITITDKLRAKQLR